MLQILVPTEDSLLSGDVPLNPTFASDASLSPDGLDPCDLFNLNDLSSVIDTSAFSLPDLDAGDVSLEALTDALAT
ncbi:hypothetical protein DVH05_021871 [Phytophthora capsici]|nr:hypothetical protein DVH05_021871 [Phytophthora capsici]